MSDLRRSLARGGAHSMVPLPRQTGAARAPVRAGGAFAMGNKAKEGTPLPVESFNLEPGGLSPPKVVGMTMRLSEEVKSALLAAQKEGLSVQMKFGMNPQNHVLKIGEREYPFTSNDEDRKTYDAYVERRDAEESSGRLVEVGPIVKKLNLQRSLTAAEANKLKQRSVAAEKQMKSRKAIVLEHSSTLDAKQAVSTAKKAVTTVRKPMMKEKPSLASRNVMSFDTTTTPSRPQQQARSRSQSPVTGPTTTPAPLGPSRLAVSSPPTEPSVSGLSPLVSTGPPDQQASRGSVPPEEGGQGKGPKAPPAKSTPKKGATNQEVKAAIVGALAGAPEHTMKPKALEKAVQNALPDDAAFTRQQFDRLLRSVATFKSPGMWVLSPDAQKAFSEGRIMNSTSPETVASDSPALNIESPPLPAPPHSETEASGPAKVETRVESTSKEGSPDDGGAKAGDLREARDLRERGGNALGASGREESEKEVVERVKEGKEQPGPGQGESTEEGEKGRETKEVEKGRETKEGQKGRESKDRNEAGRESSSSESDSGSESESDSSSGSSGSSSSEDEAEDEGADKGEMQSAEANPQREASAKENGAKGNVDTLAGQREERNHDTEESERGVETKTGVLGGLRNVDEKEGKTGVDKGAQNGSMGAEGTAGSRKDTAFKPAIEVERIDDDDEDRMGNGAGRPEKAPQAEVQGIAGDSGRKRKESEGTEGVAKRRKTEIEEQGSERRGEEKPKAVSKVGGASRKENQKSVGGLSQKALAEGEKKKTEKSGLKAGARVDLSAANDGAEKKKPKAPTEADRGKIGGVNGRDGGVNAHDGGGDERKASHAAAGPSLSDDVRNSSALSKFKAAQDLIAERKANRKAIPIELTDQTALDRRKGVKEGVKEGVKRPPSGPSRGVSKVVKGVVKGLPGSKPGGVPSRKGGENGKSSVPLARVRIERLDDGSESGPRAGSPKSGEKRRHGEEATEGAEKPRNEGVAGAKEFSGAAKDVKKGLSARKDDFGNSPLEDGELAPAAKKVKLSQNGGVDKGGMMVGKEAASERVTKPGSAKVVKPTSESGGKSKADSGVKPKPNAAKAEVKSGLNQGSTPALVKKPPQKTPGKAADGTGTKGPKKPGESRGVSANGVTNKAPGVKPAQNGGQKKAPSEPPKKSQSAAANGKVVNGKAGAQNGVVKRPAETKPVNGTRGMTEEDWVRYADAQPVLEDRTVGSLEEYHAAYDEFSTKWPVYQYLIGTLEEQRVQFLAYDKKMAAARKTHNEQQLRELELMLRVEYNKVKKVHKRMRNAFLTLHKDLAVLKPMIKAYALEHGLPIGENK